MISKMVEIFETIIGLDHINLVISMSVRALILYGLAMLSIRLNKKLLGVRTPSNFLLFIMLGSMASSAITEEGLFLPIVFTIILLNIINNVISRFFFYYPWIEDLCAGKPVVLISNGEIQWDNMKAHAITHNDLISALQFQLHRNDFSEIDIAHLNTDGTIIFIQKS